MAACMRITGEASVNRLNKNSPVNDEKLGEQNAGGKFVSAFHECHPKYLHHIQLEKDDFLKLFLDL